MKLYNVGILGATGAVGQEMMKILLERKFPVGELRPIASARSAGSEIDFGGRKCTIVEASDDAFEGLDIVLGAFAAGFVLRYIVPEGDHELERKLEGMAYGFFIPLFFIVSGAKIDVMAVFEQPALLVAFIVLLLIVRALPIFVSLSAGEKARELLRRLVRVLLLPSRLAPCHLPQRGRLFSYYFVVSASVMLVSSSCCTP